MLIIFKIIVFLSLLESFSSLSWSSASWSRSSSTIRKNIQRKRQQDSNNDHHPSFGDDKNNLAIDHLQTEIQQPSQSKGEEQKQQHQYITTPKQRDEFERNGYIVLSNLLTEDEIETLVNAGNQIVEKSESNSNKGFFKLMERGIMMSGPTTKTTSIKSNPGQTNNNNNNNTQIMHAFRNIALSSKVPIVAAELMGFGNATMNSSRDKKATTVKVLRDIFLSKGIYHNESTCGWHVDDQSFWPESYYTNECSENIPVEGINAWIAMDDMPHGGGLGVIPKSHLKSSSDINNNNTWINEAYSNLGLKDFFTSGEQSFTTKESVYNHILYAGKGGIAKSCMGIHESTSPALHSQLEMYAHYPKVKAGDVILHKRWLFHKTVPITEEGQKYYSSRIKTNKSLCLNRYSIRYVPSTAKLPRSYVYNELSLLSNPDNAGKALQDIEYHDVWYPTVWPEVDSNIDEKLKDLVNGVMHKNARELMQSNVMDIMNLLSQSQSATTTAGASEQNQEQSNKE